MSSLLHANLELKNVLENEIIITFLNEVSSSKIGDIALNSHKNVEHIERIFYMFHSARSIDD